MVSINTSDFRKGLKVQLEGDPFIMIECQFVKPGKGQALYKCKLRNLLRGTVLERTWKSGDSMNRPTLLKFRRSICIAAATLMFLCARKRNEQYELSAEIVDDGWKYLKEEMMCDLPSVQRQPDRNYASESRCASRHSGRPGSAWKYGDERHQNGKS